MRQLDPDARYFAVGLVLGVIVLGLFYGLSCMLDLRSGFFGVPPTVNHFTHH